MATDQLVAFSDGRPDSELCATCRTIDFDAIFATALGEKFCAVPVHDFGVEEDYMKLRQPGCPCCRIFSRLLPLHGVRRVLLLTKWSIMHSMPVEDVNDILILTLSVIDFRVRNEWSDVIPDNHERGYIARMSNDASLTLSPRLLQAHCIDAGVMKGWLNTCQRNHSICDFHDSTIFSADIGFRLIDCRERRIVSVTSLATNDIEFTALSYVWGASSTTSNEIDDKGGTLHDLPLTISDAMAVTLALGYRYIWVDRFCIRQNDPDDKTRQIPLMGLIYQLAVVTIVAAAGSNPDYGLPGVTTRSRREQPRARFGVGGRHYCWSSSHTSLIKGSAWMSRGWTYQEAIFSRRKLIFTDEQAYFECRSINAVESMQTPLEVAPASRLKGITICSQQPSRDLWEHIGSYLSRKLGDEADVLSAIDGIVQAQRNLEPPVYSLWGLPLSTHETLCDGPWGSSSAILHSRLKLSLLWSFWSMASRRPGFPSWSWAGWANNSWQPGRNPFSDSWMSSRCSRYRTDLDIDTRIELQFPHGGSHRWVPAHGYASYLQAHASIGQTLRISCWTMGIQLGSFPELDDYGGECRDNFASAHQAKFTIGDKHGQALVRLLNVTLNDPKSPHWQTESFMGLCFGPAGPFSTLPRAEGFTLLLFVMVVQDHGDFWERIGHFELRLTRNEDCDDTVQERFQLQMKTILLR